MGLRSASKRITGATRFNDSDLNWTASIHQQIVPKIANPKIFPPYRSGTEHD